MILAFQILPGDPGNLKGYKMNRNVRRPTLEEIQDAAYRHVAYKWSSSPGTHNRDIEWTEEDIQTYKDAYRKALTETGRF